MNEHNGGTGKTNKQTKTPDLIKSSTSQEA